MTITRTPLAPALRKEQVVVLFDGRPSQEAREELVRIYYSLAVHMARRLSGHGERFEDLLQVASIGLLKAIDRFDLSRGVAFQSFAIPTISGELKRHLRDTTWAMRVPRRLQELSLQIRTITADLGHELSRSPTIPEIAARVGISEDDVLEALHAGQTHSIASLDTSEAHDGYNSWEKAEVETSFEMTESWLGVAPLLRKLGDRERQLLYYRFIVNMPQTEIARIFGISQMHVSRLLTRTLHQLRESAQATETQDARPLDLMTAAG